MKRPLKRLMTLVCAVALLLSLPLSGAYAATIDELKALQAQLESEAANASTAVDQSTADLLAARIKVAEATQRVNEATDQVTSAQGVLDQAEADLLAAQEVERQKAAELELADLELKTAQTKEVEGQAKIDAQKTAINAYARSIVQDSMPLVNIASLINMNSTATLANRVQWNDTVLSTSQVDLDLLRTLQEELKQAREASQLARIKADQAKRAADEQVRLTTAAQQAAVQARDSLQAALDVQQAALGDQQAAQGLAEQALAGAQAELDRVAAEQDRVDADIAEAYRQAEAGRQGQQGGGSYVSSSSGLIWPVYGTLTSLYGYRYHPLWGYWGWHDGLDIGAGCGRPLAAMASGTVTRAYYDTAYGYRMFIDHGWVNGQHMMTSLNHLSGYAVGVGAWVSQGQTVGYVGTTGWSTGCHLHLMLWVNGSEVNPYGYLP